MSVDPLDTKINPIGNLNKITVGDKITFNGDVIINGDITATSGLGSEYDGTVEDLANYYTKSQSDGKHALIRSLEDTLIANCVYQIHNRFQNFIHGTGYYQRQIRLI